MATLPAFSRGAHGTAPIQPGQYRGPQSDRRPNRYGGKCVKCGVYVQAEAGWLTGSAGAWGVEHKDGQCGDAQGDYSATGGAVTPDPTTDRTGAAATTSIPDATYTVQWQDGSYKTIRVRRQDEFDDFMPGRQILSYLAGPSNDSDFTSFANIDERTGEVRIWKKHADSEILRESVKVLLGDPKAASVAYAERSSKCSRCGRTLTVPASIHSGMGPECSGKVGW